MLAKIIITLIVSTTLAGCFSSSTKTKVIIVDKSSNQQNINQGRFADNSNNHKTQKQEVVKKTSKRSWSIPVEAKVIKTFSKKHTGLTFNTKPGQQVKAIRDGKVVYASDKMKSHGKMITIRHPLGFYSSYTQNAQLLVANGDTITKGQVIATTGDKPFYFEMIKFEQAINPLKYLK